MTLDQIRQILGPPPGVDLAALLAEFRQRTGSADPIAFVNFLRGRGIATDDQARQLRALASRLPPPTPAPPRPSPAAPVAVAVSDDDDDEDDEPTSAVPAMAHEDHDEDDDDDEDDEATAAVPAYSEQEQPAPPPQQQQRQPVAPPPPQPQQQAQRTPTPAPSQRAAPVPRGAGPGGRYQLGAVVGEGGMAKVHAATDVELHRQVAFKLLAKDLMPVKGMVGRFVREARIIAQLDHPGIVPVHGFIEFAEGGAPGYAMKLIDGETFGDLIERLRLVQGQEGPLPKELSLEVRIEHFLKICDAVSFAHSKGVIHRDLKPDNIMVGRFNEAYVMDWGLAKVLDVPLASGLSGSQRVKAETSDIEAAHTRVGQILGTPAYMSPEQATGLNEELDARSDLYSLGLILFELVTLRSAIPGTTNSENIRHALQGEMAPVTHLSPKVRIDPELVAIIKRATATRTEERYQSVAEFAEDLRHHRAGEAPAALPDNPPRRAMRWLSENSLATLILLTLALLVAVVAVTGTLLRQESDAAVAKKREQRIGQFVATVTRQGHAIDSRLLYYEALLEGLSGATVQALANATSGGEQVYFDTDFTDPQRAPEDLARSPHYKTSISLSHAAFKMAPDVSLAEVGRTLGRLASLRHHFLRMLLRSHSDDAQKLGPGRARALLMKEGAPLNSAYVGLEHGVHVGFPGHGRYPKEHDPRNRPWYRLSALKYGVRWGNPHLDILGQGLVLPCSISLYDAGDDFLGVAGLELTFGYIISSLMQLEGIRHVRESFLVDDAGRVVVRSSHGSRGSGGDGGGADERSDDSMWLQPYELREVTRAMKGGGAGYVETQRDDADLVVGFHELHILGWRYVVEADAAEIVGGT